MKTLPISLAPARYGSLAIGLHWTLALAIVGQFVFGLYMTTLPFSPGRVQQFTWHKWLGISILTLSAMRLLWRLISPPPPAIAMPAWQERAASYTHILLYALFFATPLAGWAYTSAAGFPVVVFGILPLPDWVEKNAELAPQFKLLHKFLAYSLAALVALHVAGALKHHFIEKDGLLRRMNPFIR